MISACADTVTAWQRMIYYSTQLKQALVAGTKQHAAKLDQSGGIPVFGVDVLFISRLLLFGARRDCHLSFDDHISVVRVYNYNIRTLHQFRPLINRETANIITCSIVCTKLDYCNSVPHGVTESNMDRLQRVPNARARIVCTAAPYLTPTSDLRKSFHWP